MAEAAGGPDQPDVVLYGKPNEQPLAFVSLSQVPYTGFAAGPLLTLAFWLAVALWSAGIAYVLMGRQSMRLIAARVFSFAPAVVEYDEGAYGEDMPAPTRSEPVRMSAVATRMPAVSVMPMPATAVAPAPMSAPVATEGIPDLADVIETRAHAAGVLLSPEALSMALGLSSDRAENLRIFGDILNEAVRSVPREDGWILLSSDRFGDIAQKFAQTSVPASLATFLPSAAPLAAVDESAVSQLAKAAVSGDRESAFSLIRTAETGGMNPLPLMTGVATALDQLYHARRDGTRIADVALQEKASGISDESLEKMVELFTHATGKAYASPYTGVKLALAQAFEARA